MNLTPRCDKMLPNAMQCPNDSVPPSKFCVLHIEEDRDAQLLKARQEEAAKEAQIDNVNEAQTT